MPLRQIDIYLPKEKGLLPDIEEEYDVLDRRDWNLEDGSRVARMLIETKNAEALLDWLHEEISDVEGHRIVITSVAATLPRPTDKEEEEEQDDNGV